MSPHRWPNTTGQPPPQEPMPRTRALPPEQMSDLERRICAGMMTALDDAELIVDGEEWTSSIRWDDSSVQDGELDVCDEAGHVVRIEFTVRVVEETRT